MNVLRDRILLYALVVWKDGLWIKFHCWKHVCTWKRCESINTRRERALHLFVEGVELTRHRVRLGVGFGALGRAHGVVLAQQAWRANKQVAKRLNPLAAPILSARHSRCAHPLDWQEPTPRLTPRAPSQRAHAQMAPTPDHPSHPLMLLWRNWEILLCTFACVEARSRRFYELPLVKCR